MLHKEAWVTKILGTHLSIQVHKKVKFSWRDNSPLALKGLMIWFGGMSEKRNGTSPNTVYTGNSGKW